MLGLVFDHIRGNLRWGNSQPCMAQIVKEIEFFLVEMEKLKGEIEEP